MVIVCGFIVCGHICPSYHTVCARSCVRASTLYVITLVDSTPLCVTYLLHTVWCVYSVCFDISSPYATL